MILILIILILVIAVDVYVTVKNTQELAAYRHRYSGRGVNVEGDPMAITQPDDVKGML